MEARSAAASVVRHVGGVAAEATLVAALVATVALALSPVYAPAKFLAGTDKADAAKVSGVITVQQPVAYGQTTMATVNPGGANVYVFVQCYAPTLGGKYVYAAYFPVDGDNHATLGPLWSTLWPASGAGCRATEGYFTRNGFGKWVALAVTSFTVDP